MKNIILLSLSILCLSACIHEKKPDPAQQFVIDISKQIAEQKIMEAKMKEHLDAVTNRDLVIMESTLTPNGNMQLILPGSEIIQSNAGFMDYHRENNVNIKIVRIFNTYGPNMNPEDGRVVSNFIMQALKGEDITIFGDGIQTRSFQYIDDLVEGMIRMMNSSKEFIGPVNIGNPNEFTMLELAEKILTITGSKSKLVFKPLPLDDPRQRQPDISLAKTSLQGWEPKIELEKGLIKAIYYFKTQL